MYFFFTGDYCRVKHLYASVHLCKFDFSGYFLPSIFYQFIGLNNELHYKFSDYKQYFD